MKLCTKCNVRKKNSEFTKSKNKLAGYCKDCQKVYNVEYRSSKNGYLKNCLSHARGRAKDKKLEFDLDIEFLESIVTDKCPVFGMELLYKSSLNGPGKVHPHAAALDRVIPELGYIKGNVVFISQIANTIKSYATELQLYTVADWLHKIRKEVRSAFKDKLASISEESHRKSEHYTEPRVVLAARSGQDSNDINNYCGSNERQDADHSSQESGGDSVGQRSEEVATLEAPKSEQDNWKLHPTYGWIEC